MRYSFIIPVYNRPDEVDELLESLTKQTLKDFEVVVVEDGSSVPCKEVVNKYTTELSIQYIDKENSGQGFSRNVGFEHAKGEFFILMDSDCIVPDTYLQAVDDGIQEKNLDAFGGPDRAHPSFTDIQKAINYSMTSFFTTGGIRDKEDGLEQYHPRSFNMGFKRSIVDKVGGFKITRMGEDIEFSERIIRSGYKVGLIKEAIVYHKRRTSFKHFAKQLHFFGRARINISRFYPDQLKLVHAFPAVFLIGLTATIALWLTLLFGDLTGEIPSIYQLNEVSNPYLLSVFVSALVSLVAYKIYGITLFADALSKEKSLKIALMSVIAAYIQLCSYGLGFLSEKLRKHPKMG